MRSISMIDGYFGYEVWGGCIGIGIIEDFEVCL